MKDERPPTRQEPAAAPAARAAARARVSRYYFGAAVITAGLVALFFLLAPPPLARSHGAALSAVFGAVAGLALLALRLPASWYELALTAVTLAGMAAVGLSSVLIGWGLGGPGLGFFGLYAGLMCVVVGARQGALVALFGLLVVGLLGAGEAEQWWPIESNAVGAPLWSQMAVQAMLIVSGFGGGWVVSHALQQQVQTVQDRERRFRGLLHIAADAYWELSPTFRLTALTRERDGGRVLGPESGVGSVPWELPAFRCDSEALDQLRADLEGRQAFRDMPCAWVEGVRQRHFLISGEPRTDAQGRFAGYWGVARDVTSDLRARADLAATETRYQDLFTRIPSALVLHRHGLVMDANPSALALFGYRDLSSIVGRDLLQLYVSGDSRERARRRMEQLQDMPSGEALPVTEFILTSRTGRRIVTRATGVAVDTPSGPAVLSIYVDDTERKVAEEAVRRSEAVLSHLVASSPDIITLTDFATGRYAMVNRTFERVIGYRADDVIGRTSLELGVWTDEADRADFVAQLREAGRVQDVPTQFTTRDGRSLPMLVSGARFTMDRREFLVINARDVTEIERSRLEREAILDNASIGIALTRDQVFQLVNPAFEEMLGWPDGSIIGQPGQVLWPDEAAYREVGARIAPALARGEKIEIECEVRRHDGGLFLCRMLACAVDPRHPSRGGTIWIVEDITERRRVDMALARARDEAEAASRAKSAFLANTSHELRTPLNGLLGLAQLARAPGLDDGRRARYLDQIVDSAHDLALIVSDILDLSKIEAGKLSVEQAAFDLRGLLQALQRSHGAAAAAKSLALSLDVDARIHHVDGDSLRVRQIVGNFLDNAIKFTSQGQIQLRARRLEDGAVRIEVHDSGPGIDIDTQARLFRPFTQADDSTTRRFGGTGLGLSICRQLAQLLGGEVGVSSQSGRGSCFWVELPLPAAAEAADSTGTAPHDSAATHGVHVLIVDDNEINLMVAVAQLEQFGVRVGQATDGQQALDAVAAAEASGDPFDLVMMDLQMPIKSGHEVTRELRLRLDATELPIVAYTAAALVTERDAALASGMNDFLPKPSLAEELRAMVARWTTVRPGPA